MKKKPVKVNECNNIPWEWDDLEIPNFLKRKVVSPVVIHSSLDIPSKHIPKGKPKRK